MTKTRWMGLVGASVIFVAGLVRADGPLDLGPKIREAILGLDLDDARKAVEGAAKVAPNSMELDFERARLAIYDGDCDAALTLLARPDLQRIEAAQSLTEIAAGCARTTAATIVDKDEARGVEIRYQDDEDRALTPVLVDTIVRARESLTRDLGVTWPKVTRFVVVRDLLALAAMTGLPYESAKTTGTVGVAKWGRVTLLSPRASRHGYAWRDTIAHELTHLAVTRATLDRAPLWLQEGMAKREEVRWRAAGPFDDRPSPEAVALRGMDLKLDLPLDNLGPSIAMLPTADAAMVAFAEVTSFVRYLADTGAPGSLPKLFSELRAGKSPDEALVAATGGDLKKWDGEWRTWLKARPRETVPSAFGLGAMPPNLNEIRERSRLAELLLARKHPEAALAELSKLPANAIGDDPALRALEAEVLLANGKPTDATKHVGEPKDVAAPYAPWWAIGGVLARGRGDEKAAEHAFVEAVAQDPFDVLAACETRDSASAPTSPDSRILCEAARRYGALND